MKRYLPAAIVIPIGLMCIGCEREKTPPLQSERPAVPGGLERRSSVAAADSEHSTPAPMPIRETTPREGAARDLDITDRLGEAIRSDPALTEQARRVSVTAVNGIVVLRGTVPTQNDKDIIHARASAMPTVIRVDDKIEVVDTPAP